MAGELRGLRALSDDERTLLKMMFVTGQYTLAQTARIMRVDYAVVRQTAHNERWGVERENFLKETAGASAATAQALTDAFKLRCFRIFDRILANYDEILERHEVHDSFQSFPFDSFSTVLNQLLTFMGAVGALQGARVDQINVNVQQNIDQREQSLLHVDGGRAKEALGKILTEFVRNRRPPERVEGEVLPGNTPDPASGQHR